jgi:plastocyanin
MTGGTDRASRAGLVAVLAAVAFAVPVAPALAADQTVQVGNDKTLSPTAVTVVSGERVTWRWAGPAGDTDHIIASHPNQAESWDSDPGVSSDNPVDHPVGRTFSHTFGAAGSFSYQCRVHSQMQGTVSVTAAPVASFTATPSTVLTGEAVSFDASASSVAGGTIVRHRWDLDGNGSFETDTGADPRASRAYASAGTITVRLRVSDAGGATADTTRSVTVNEAPAAVPTAAAPSAAAALAPPPVATLLKASIRDTAAPTSRLDRPATQRLARRKAIVVTGTWSEDSTVAAAATITVPGARPLKLVGPRRSVRAGAKVTLTLRLSGRTLAAVSRALARGARVGARVTLSATDAAGNGSVATLRVRLAR